MATLNINGKRVTVDDAFLSLSQEEQQKTVEEIASQIGAGQRMPDGLQSSDMSEMSGMLDDFRGDDKYAQDTNIRANMEARQLESMLGNRANPSLFVLGASMGLGDDVSAVLNTPFRMIRDRVGPGEAYTRQRALESAMVDRAREKAGVMGTVAEIGGGLLTGVAATKAGPMMRAAQSGLGARMAAGAGEGAFLGGIAGFGNAEGGLVDKASGAAAGTAFGLAAGGAIPAIGAGVRAATKPVRDAISARVNPQGFADRKVVERLTADGKSISQLSNQMREGMSLADAGGASSRTLLRTTVNVPGPAKEKVTAALIRRQFGQGDRLKTAIEKTFADPDAYLSVKDDIAARAKEIAAPLYREAYEKPIPYTQSLEGILKTNAGKRALAKAKEMASNEQAPFRQWFANIADDGTITRKRVPDMRAWDYIKRALDDMIDGQTDSITRKTTNEGRILVDLKNKMLAELDMHNPAYAAARAASADGFVLDRAIETGRKAMTMEPAALRRAVAGMTPPEKEAVRVGAAEALRKRIDDAGYTHDAVLKIWGNRRDVANLATLFDDEKQFSAFRRQVFAEMRKRATYNAVRGNSTTAAQMADMMDAGGLNETVGALQTAATGRPGAAVLQYIGSRMRMLGGLTPEVADRISQRLMATNPQALQEIVTGLQQIERAQISADAKRAAIEALLVRAGAIGGGTALANQ